jgi:hypothetical protein
VERGKIHADDYQNIIWSYQRYSNRTFKLVLEIWTAV